MVKTLLQKIGISQRTLAAYIDSDHTVLNRFANGDIYLKPHVAPQLHKILSLGNNIIDTSELAPTEQEKMAMLQEAVFIKNKCRPIQKKLDTMQLNYIQATSMLKLLSLLGPATPDEKPKKQRWLDEQKYQAEEKMQRNGWLAQNKLQIAIKLIEHEAALWQIAVNADKVVK